MPWSQQLVPGPVLCQDFAANHGLLLPPLPAALGPWCPSWGDGGSRALQLMSAELRMAPEGRGHGLESPGLPGQNQGPASVPGRGTWRGGEPPGWGAEPPERWRWSRTRLGRRVGTKSAPAHLAAGARQPIQSAAETVIGGRGPWLHPFSLTS